MTDELEELKALVVQKPLIKPDRELIVEALKLRDEVDRLNLQNVLLRTALKGLLTDYRTEGCADPECRQCKRSKIALQFAKDAMEAK